MMKPQKTLSLLLGLILLLGITACSSSTLLQTWVNPDLNEKSASILVLAATKNPASRQLFESELARQLTDHGVRSIPSFTVMPKDEVISKEAIIQIALQNKVDSVIVATVLDTRQEQQTVTTIQSDAGRYRSGYYNRDRDWYNNYSGGYTTVNSYQNNFTIANVETSLYQLTSETMLWTALSETVTLNAGAQDIKALTVTIAKELKKDGMI